MVQPTAVPLPSISADPRSICAELRSRWEKGRIYSNVGSVTRPIYPPIHSTIQQLPVQQLIRRRLKPPKGATAVSPPQAANMPPPPVLPAAALCREMDYFLKVLLAVNPYRNIFSSSDSGAKESIYSDEIARAYYAVSGGRHTWQPCPPCTRAEGHARHPPLPLPLDSRTPLCGPWAAPAVAVGPNTRNTRSSSPSQRRSFGRGEGAARRAGEGRMCCEWLCLPTPRPLLQFPRG